MFLSSTLSRLFVRRRAPLSLPSTSSLAQFAVPVHAPLEDTRCSRMHTRAYIRRVLRKLAPYVSIQISYVCTYSDLPVRLSLAVLLLPSIHSSPRRFRPLQSNGFLSLSNSHTQCRP